MAKEGYTTQQHREWLTITLTEIKGDVSHIKEKVEKNEKHLSKLNNRIGKAETNISAMQGVGSVVALIFGTIFGFLFNKN